MKEIRLTGEHWRDNLVGMTFNKPLEEAIMRKHTIEIGIERSEQRAKQLKEQLKRFDSELSIETITTLQNISEGAFVTAVNPDNEITDIGFNCPDDLVLDNFGLWLASFVRSPISASTSVNLTDTANSSQQFQIYAISSSYNTFNNNGAIGTMLQVGSGSTAAARSNYAIQTAFGTGPEASRFGTSNGGYGSGSISFSGAISAGGSGTVNELGCFGAFNNVSSQTKYVMLFHDILSSGVSFTPGTTLNASYSIQM
jgi:hypothetical protein